MSRERGGAPTGARRLPRGGDAQLGVAALVAAAGLVAWAIPSFVSTPSNVPNVVLSPLFWPYALAGLTALVGLGLLARAAAPRAGDVAGPSGAARPDGGPDAEAGAATGREAAVGREAATGREAAGDDPFGEPPSRAAAVGRVLALAALMLAMLWLLPRLGMVWTSMLAFAALAFLVATPHRRTALLCAALVPLALYAFFAHVAGIAIPQGDVAADYVRLP